MDINIPLAIFGAIYEGDPMSEPGESKVVIQETLYPPLVELARHYGVSPRDVYDQIVRHGRIEIMGAEELVVVTHAYTHDNNTSRRLQ